MEQLQAILQRLTFAELERWAGKKIVDRGRSYLKRVDGLCRHGAEDLVAWVSGTEDYATLVRLDPDHQHSWYCTCPYDDGPCKHAVAVILAAAQQVKDQQEIKELDADDDLSLMLFGDPEDDCEEEEEIEPEPAAKGSKGTAKEGSKVRKLLEGKTREELVDLLVNLAKIHPDIEQSLRESEQLCRGQVAPLVRALRKEILHLTSEPAWRNHWNNEGSVPDYSHVQRQFEAFFAAGHFDELLELGDLLWREGSEQVEQSDDDGESATDIGECLEVVVAAVPKSSLPRPQQLLWLIQRRLSDEFGLLDGAMWVLESKEYNRDDWRVVVTALEERLQAKTVSRTANSSETYSRHDEVNCLLDAYQRAGLSEHIQPLLEAEVDRCRNYEQLVRHLLQAGNRDLARQWCIRGFNATIEQSPGLAADLQKQLRTMAEEEKQTELVAAYRAQDFFLHPTVDTFKELRKSLDKSPRWPKLREQVLAFLEGGQRPDLPGKKGVAADWPLPVPEVVFPHDKGRGLPGSRMASLIDIAILEKRFDEVVRLYELTKKNKIEGWGLGERVAQAVAKTHPEMSLSIWRAKVDGLIAQVKPQAYNEAAVFLRHMRKVYEAGGQMAQWQALLSELRQTHKAKRRLLEVLDGLGGTSKKIAS